MARPDSSPVAKLSELRRLAQAAGHADHPRKKLSLARSLHVSDAWASAATDQTGLTEGCQRGSIQKADGLCLDVLGPPPLAFQTAFQCGAKGAMVQEREAILKSRFQYRPHDFRRVDAVLCFLRKRNVLEAEVLACFCTEVATGASTTVCQKSCAGPFVKSASGPAARRKAQAARV